jgi:hypothetical protein
MAAQEAKNLFPKIGQGWLMPSWVDYEILR